MDKELQNWRLKINLKVLAVYAFAVILAIALGSQIPKWFSPSGPRVVYGDYQRQLSPYQRPLSLYGTSTCPACKSARKFLNDSGIAFNDLLIDKSERFNAEFKALNQTAVPVLLDSKMMIVGFDKDLYLQAANRR